MTDKELKKLSKPELLELVTAQSCENDRLSEELKRAKKEKTIERNTQYLNEIANELNSALKKVSSMLSGADISTESSLNDNTVNENCKPDSTAAQEVTETAKQEEFPPTEKPVSTYKSVDYNIYKSLMVFFIKNPYSLEVFPDDLREDITKRIDDIKSKLKAKGK